ncbi:MAG: sulfotransferase family 2 domain-containing protein [Pseudomonadota bacterium]
MAGPGDAVKTALWSLEQRLPEGARMRLLCHRRRGHWAQAGVIFVHVPKAAGTSISHLLYGRSLGHLPAVAIRRHCPVLWSDLPSFAVMRAPLERALSAWRFARQGGTSLAGIGREGRERAGQSDFAGFVDGYLSQIDLDRADPVFRPQAHYLCDAAGEMLPDAVFPFDRLDLLRDWLRARLGRAVSLPALNRSDAGEERCDPTLRKRIEALYAQDVDLYARVSA